MTFAVFSDIVCELPQGISEEAAYDIEKDVGRTFPGLAK
jgi:hypothetical protein